jgi:long-chain acyl-CoA synthetase
MAAKIFGTDAVRTFADFERDALVMAAVLRERGVNPQDRVLLKAENSVGYLTVLFALMHGGVSIVLVDNQESAEATRRIVGRAGVKTSIVDDNVADGGTHDPLWIYDLQVAAAGRAPTERQLSIDAWCEMPDGLVMWSSGSTGAPKAIVKSGAGFVRNIERGMKLMGHRAEDVLMPLLPFSHQWGLGIVVIAWLARCSLVVAPYRRLDRALRMAVQSRVTVFDATPATYRSMLTITAKRPELRAALVSARMLCVGAAPLDPGVTVRYAEELGQTLLDGYGSTEMGNISFATPDNPVATGQVMDGIEVAITADDGRRLPPGQTGEIMIRTPDGMTGYLEENGQVAQIGAGWYATGDLGQFDEDGNLTVFGRKLAVSRMGYTIYPEMIERKVGAAGCAAKIVALPDDRRGSKLIAFVEDESEREAAFWRELMADVLAGYEMPNQVVVLSSFPLNRTGKPDRGQLTKMAAAHS